MTPQGMFDELVKNAESSMRRSAGEDKRRQAWLANDEDEAEAAAAAEEPQVPARGARVDMYDLNLDRFVDLGGPRPAGWREAVKIAAWIQIDEMRTMLELHYDNIHLERYLAIGKAQQRRSSEYKVFGYVAQSHRLKLCQRISLPDSLKAIFRCPAHEDSLAKLEEARLAIARHVQGEKDFEIESEADADDLVAALQRSPGAHPDELRGHDVYPDGSRVVAEQPPADLTIARQRGMVCDAVSKSVGRTLTIRTRPLSSNPPLDSFAKAVVDPKMTVKVISATAKFNRLSKEALLDRLLLVLHDALFLDACLTWTANGVSNLHCSETLPLARYFLRGLSVGDAPIFRGLCAFCARLLGAPTDKIVGSKAGPPIDRHGAKLLDEFGAPDPHAQPPCLLRYSPSLFAKEAPATFDWDAATNRLTLKPGQPPPWLRQSVPPGDPNHWLYCDECYTHWIGPTDRRRSPCGVPFRDKASQCMMRPTWKSQQQREQTAAQEAPVAPPTAAAGFGMDRSDDEDQGEVTDDVFDDAGPDHPGGTIGEPESEPEIEPGTPGAKAEPEVGLEDDDSDDEVADHDKGLPVEAAAPALPVLQQEPRPSLESYTKKWAGLLAQHSKAVVGEFSASNLVPLPIHVLWQDCPHVPFDELKTEEAQARLSVCKPISGLQESTRVGGVERYAHSSGEVFLFCCLFT